MKTLAVTALALLLVACGRDEKQDERLEIRQAASRNACVSLQLAQEAQEQTDVLRPTMEGSGAVPAAAVFAQAFEQHARLRAAGYAQLDSALNHSATTADSLRHARAAEGFTINAPEPGSVEANVMNDYNRRFLRMAANPRHPCLWQAEEIGKE